MLTPSTDDADDAPPDEDKDDEVPPKPFATELSFVGGALNPLPKDASAFMALELSVEEPPTPIPPLPNDDDDSPDAAATWILTNELGAPFGSTGFDAFEPVDPEEPFVVKETVANGFAGGGGGGGTDEDDVVGACCGGGIMRGPRRLRLAFTLLRPRNSSADAF